MHNPEIDDALGAADSFIHALRIVFENCKGLNGEGKDYCAIHLLLDAVETEINNAIEAFDQIGDPVDNGEK